MRWCRTCVTPTTRPRVVFKDEICNACRWHEKKKAIDWDSRKKMLMHFCDRFRDGNGAHNVVVPVSGQGYGAEFLAYALPAEE